MSMGSTKQLTAIFKNFGLFVLLGPIGCTNISRVVIISKIPDVAYNKTPFINETDYAELFGLCGICPIMRKVTNYAQAAKLCARIIPRSVAYCAALNSICADETTLRRSSSSSDHSNDVVQLQRQISAARARAAEHRCCSPTVDRRDRQTERHGTVTLTLAGRSGLLSVGRSCPSDANSLHGTCQRHLFLNLLKVTSVHQSSHRPTRLLFQYPAHYLDIVRILALHCLRAYSKEFFVVHNFKSSCML